MSHPQKKLSEWTEQGLLSPQQAEAIALYERKRGGGLGMLFSFSSLGYGVLSLGIISLIAANWHLIPDGIKLGGHFLLLLIAALFLYTFHDPARDESERHTAIFREGLHLFYLLMCMAYIGLVSQVYHTGGELEDALLFWAVLTFSVTLLARGSVSPFLWTTLFFSAALMQIGESEWLRDMWPRPDHRLQVVLYSLPLLLLSFSRFFQLFPRMHHHAAASRFWAYASGLTALAVADFFHGFDSQPSIPDLTPLVPVLMFAVLHAALDHGRFRSPVRRLLAVILIGLYLTQIAAGVRAGESTFLAALLTVGTLFAAAVWMGLDKNRRLFHLLVILIALRFFIAYLIAFGGLALTGIGLIFSGLLILTILWLWRRHQPRILLWLESLE